MKENVIEVDTADDKIKIWALSKRGSWVTVAEIVITPEMWDFCRMPLLLKVEPGQERTVPQNTVINMREMPDVDFPKWVEEKLIPVLKDIMAYRGGTL